MEGLAETARSGGIIARTVDLRDRAFGAASIGQIETQTGRAIDVLVNNAGGVEGQRPVPLEDVTDHDWNNVLRHQCECGLYALPRGGASLGPEPG